MRAIEAFADLKQQKKSWFSAEDPEGSSYEEEIENLMSCSEMLPLSKHPKYLNAECRSLLKQLIEQIDAYDRNPETYLNGCSADTLFTDPKWLSIVALAQKTYHQLEAFKKEVLNG